MRVDMLTAHSDDLGDRIGQLFGVNVYEDPHEKTIAREDRFATLLVALRKKSKTSEDAHVVAAVTRPSREFPLLDCMLAQTNAGDTVRLEQRRDMLWNIVSHDGPSTFGVDEKTLFALVKPLEVAT